MRKRKRKVTAAKSNHASQGIEALRNVNINKLSST
jgi:hypothetical protein